MKEPQVKYSMSTGLQHNEDDEKLRKYPLESAEQSFLKFIADQAETGKKYQDKIEKIRQESENKAKRF